MASKDFLGGYRTYDNSNRQGSRKSWRDAFRGRIEEEMQKKGITDYEKLSPYEILKISISATKTEIKKAYRKASFEWHPDKNQDNLEEAEKMMKLINKAYEKLK